MRGFNKNALPILVDSNLLKRNVIILRMLKHNKIPFSLHSDDSSYQILLIVELKLK